jgi:hypothetical protein
MDHERGALIQRVLGQYAVLSECLIVPTLDDPQRLWGLLDALSAAELRIVAAAFDLLAPAVSRD